jgi:hypothetical protein
MMVTDLGFKAEFVISRKPTGLIEEEATPLVAPIDNLIFLELGEAAGDTFPDLNPFASTSFKVVLGVFVVCKTSFSLSAVLVSTGFEAIPGRCNIVPPEFFPQKTRVYHF